MFIDDAELRMSLESMKSCYSLNVLSKNLRCYPYWFNGISTLLGYLMPNPVLYIYIYIYIYIFFHHTTCESTCDTLASSAANQGDNTVSVAQGGRNCVITLVGG